ncbi:Ax21 family protein [Luteimonas sp. RD2P54]|uniref:Ax21 family protein n=1 Tax=Luteimonas endophytica TaxID=3042023 RepID=A0ABT6JAX6_9GAMM|nr:Ax21 family protein [Luteimonas endophytica]MDH5823313.1 Ax21 family protein [Luteimonas endophytica]
MKRSLLALTLAAALPFAAAHAAEGISYNYVEGGYSATNGDGDADADGFGANASFAFHPNFHVFGGYLNQEIDDTDRDFDQFRVGVGYNHEISPRADLVTRIAYEKVDAGRDLLGNRIDPDGYSAEVGVRGALTTNFEGYAMAGYEDYGSDDGFDYEGDFYGRLGAQLKFNPNWGVSGDVKFADGDTQWFVGPRFTW